MNMNVNPVTTQPVRISAILAQVATMVEITSTSLGMTRTDKTASQELDRAKNAEHGTTRAQVARLTPAGADRVRDINRVATEARQALYAMTMPFQNMQVMPNDAIQRWLGVYAPIKAKHTALVTSFIADAPQLIADAETNLVNFTVAPPTEEEIRSAFSLDFNMQQIPDSANFAANGVTNAMQEEMRRHFERGIEAAYHNAQRDALQRVAEPVGHLIERLAAYDAKLDDHANGKVNKGGKLYETTITNVQDIANVFRSFNLTGDPLMDSLAAKLDAFADIGIDDIKTDSNLRKHLTKSAEDILADLQDLI